MTTPFLRGEIALPVSSSNVRWIKFFPSTNELMVQFHHGQPYTYPSTASEAAMMSLSISKGKFVWANLIGRGFKRYPASYDPERKIKQQQEAEQYPELAEDEIIIEE